MAFRGEADRWNPELLLVAALSSCHQLWYLHLCAEAGVVVVSYADEAEATLTFTSSLGRFESALLRPQVTIGAASDYEKALALHDEAHRLCFVANAVTFEVRHEASITVEERA